MEERGGAEKKLFAAYIAYFTVPGLGISMRWWSLTPSAQRPTPSRPGNPQFGIMYMTIQKYIPAGPDGSGLGEHQLPLRLIKQRRHSFCGGDVQLKRRAAISEDE